MNIKYTLGAIISVPLLPFLYFQGKKLRKTIPQLPEATGIEGICKASSNEMFQLITIGESTIAGVGATTHETAFTGTLAKELAEKLGKNISWMTKINKSRPIITKKTCLMLYMSMIISHI